MKKIFVTIFIGIIFLGSSIFLNRVDAKDNLIANKAFMAADVNAYVANTYPSHSHDAAKCTRDTGYLIDGLAYDILYGGTQATMRNADSFPNAILT